MEFSIKVLETAFNHHEIPKLKEEIVRLFRSNAFNTVQRAQFEQ